MKKLIYVLSLSFLALISCTQDDSIISPTNEASLLALTQNREAIVNAFNHHYSSKSNSFTREKGAKFIQPFMFGEGFGTADFSNFPIVEFAGFDLTYDLQKGDFYRENTDGTITVHANSNKASAVYAIDDWSTGENIVLKEGYPAHLSINYTGTLVEFPIIDENGNVIFVIKFIDLNSPSSSVNVHGKGKVVDQATEEENKMSLTYLKNKTKFVFELLLD